MLVLTRKTNQSITIGNQVTVTVVEIRGDSVKLGIDAPREVAVDREEIAIDKWLKRGARRWKCC